MDTMKMLKYVLVAGLAMGFAGCLDVNEKIDMKKDGSGTLTMDMNMGQMLDMLESYMGKDELEKKGVQKMDTTINLKDILATDTSLPADKKALLSAGSVHIQLDPDQKIFTTHMRFPFSSQQNLQKLYSVISDGSLGTAQLFRDMGGAEGGSVASPDINQFNGIYDFTSRNGLISKKVNVDKWKALMNDPQMAQIKAASQLGSGTDVTYTTTVVLPRPAKKVDNSLAQLSDDKKTVIMKFNLLDVLDHPEKFNYSIEY